MHGRSGTEADEEPASEELREFGRQVRRSRERLAWTQEPPSQSCGLHRTYVGGIERGERNPTLLAVHKLARGLRVTAAELLGECPPAR